MIVANGDTTHQIPFLALDAVGNPVPELSSFTVYRSRAGGTPVAMTTPTVTELDAINMPGKYALLLNEDTTIDAASPVSEMMSLRISASGMQTVDIDVELQRYATIDGSNRIAASDVAGGINTSSGVITTLDALDTAQNTQHAATQSGVSGLVGGVQSRVNYSPTYVVEVGNRDQANYKCNKRLRFKAGTIDVKKAIGIDMSPRFGPHVQVDTVGDPTVSSGSSITMTALGPRDEPPRQLAMIKPGGTATAGEIVTVEVEVTMANGDSEPVELEIEVE